jgi:NADH dehydrogenase
MDGLVTVFGGSGFVGGNIVRVLAQAGWRIRVAVRKPHLAQHLAVHGQVGQIQLTAANVRMPGTVRKALEGATACVNVVGLQHQHGGQRFAAVHAGGARHIAEAAREFGVERLVYISGINAGRESESLLARAKAEAEAVVHEQVPSAVILRPSVVFGAGDQFFNKLASIAAMSPVSPLIGGGKTRIQPVYVGDVARAVAAALDMPAARGRTYELGGPNIYTLRELTEMVLTETGRRRALVPLPFFAASALGAVAELVGLVGFEPPLTREQVALLKQDNVADPRLPGLQALGVTPTAPEGVIGSYLYKYRKAGQFSAEPQRSVTARGG